MSVPGSRGIREQDAMCDWAPCHQGPLSNGMEHSSASSFWKDEAAGGLVQEPRLVIAEGYFRRHCHPPHAWARGSPKARPEESPAFAAGSRRA